LELQTQVIDGLQEHDRHGVPHMRSGEFISMIELLFRKPHECVLGNESANEALERFEAAIGAITSKAKETVAVVTHGTVLALFLAQHNPDRRGFELWRQLGLPSFAVVSTSDFQIEELVEKVG
jgi:broad specificity phosphatase PhoE